MTVHLPSISESEEVLFPPIKAPGISRKKRRHRSIMSSQDQSMKTVSGDESDVSAIAWENAMSEIQRLNEALDNRNEIINKRNEEINKRNEEIKKLNELVATMMRQQSRSKSKK